MIMMGKNITMTFDMKYMILREGRKCPFLKVLRS